MIAAIPLISSLLSAGASSAPAPAAASGVTPAGGDFTQVLSKMSTDAMHTMKDAESQAIQGIQGKTDLQSVVQSVMSAQGTLQTALAIRDKTVSAFQEVTRMQI